MVRRSERELSRDTSWQRPWSFEYWISCLFQGRRRWKRIRLHPGPGGGSTSLFGLNGYVPPNRLRFFRVLRLKHGIQFHYLASWTGYLSGLETLNPTCGYQQLLFFIKKKNLSVWEVKNKAAKQRRTQAKYKGEMNGFCLKQGQGLKASAHPHPSLP